MKWLPRLPAFAFALFLAAFAVDALDKGAVDVAMHLVPSAVVLIIVMLSWRREPLGALAFTGMAIAYAVAARAHPSWIAAISGPLLAIAALYAWNWMRRPTAARVRS